MSQMETEQNKPSGLNLIRFVFGVYYLAVSVSLLDGLDFSALFRGNVPAPLDHTIGAIFLFVLALSYALGFLMRISAIGLALFVLMSSGFSMVTRPDLTQAADHWVNMTMACAVLLSFMALDTDQLSRAPIVQWHRDKVRALAAKLKGPRRIEPFSQTANHHQAVARVNARRPAKSAANETLGVDPRPKRRVDLTADEKVEDVNNIFDSI